VVLALLALLGLIAAALSVSVRMELASSLNSGQVISTSIAVRGTLSEALGYLEGATSVTHLLQPWAQARMVTKEGRAPKQSRTVRVKRGGRADDAVPRPYDLQISDLSGRLNLNAVRDANVFARFLLAVMPQDMANGTALTRAQAMLQWRGAFQDWATTACLDLRVAPPPGFRRIEHIEQLIATSDNPLLFTRDEVTKLAPYVTVFSMASESQNVGAGAVVGKSTPPAIAEKISLKDLTAEKAYAVLAAAFPDKEDRLLRQYAVNLADVLDDDDVPSRLSDPKHPEPWNDLLGIERTPFITEVYPDSVTRGSDEGQFVELYNPWAEPVSVEGWRLVVSGGANGLLGSAMIALTGQIAPNGYLIVTDQYDVPAPQSEPGTGCFLAIFGRKGDETNRRVIQSAALELPNKNSFVTLVNERGQLIDIFSYTDRAKADSRESYQRVDPTVRAFIVAEATPFEQYAADRTAPARELLRSIEALRRDVRSGKEFGLGHLFLIPTSYVGLSGNSSVKRFVPHLAQLPEIGRQQRSGGKLEQTDATNLDARLVDIFATRSAVRGAGDYPNSTLLHSYGKLNVNTCVPEALWGLDGSSGGVELITPQFVSNFKNYRQGYYQAGLVPFARLSDFANLVAAQGIFDTSAAAALSKLLDQVCVGSLAFEVVSQTPSKVSSEKKSAWLPQVRCYWILGLDFRPCSVIHFAENSW
jgi:hypothetical protein